MSERLDNPLRLHLNENTAGCSSAVLAAIRDIGRDDVACYPDYAKVTTAAERWLGVSPGWLQLTNGLDEGIHVIAQSVAAGCARNGSPPRAAVIVEPAFEMYALCAEAAALPVTKVAPIEAFAFPLDDVLATIGRGAGVVYLTDPNNPTGIGIPREALVRICESAGDAGDAIVLVDEAYAEFSGRTCVPLLTRFRNLVIGRTFAKAHGLAGLRIGALIAHPGTLAPLRRILPPYTLNVCAMRALEAALQDADYLSQSVAQARESRELIYGFCERHGMRYWPSEANFVLLRVGGGAPAIVRALAARGVLVRDRSDQPGCQGCIRITAGVVAHTRRCLAILEEILATRAD